MSRFRTALLPQHWLLPVVLAAVQAALFPVMHGLLEIAPPTRSDTVVALLITTVTGLALCWRRVTPIPVMIVVASLITLQLWIFPDGETFLIGICGYVALYSVAVRSGDRPAVIATVGMVLADVAGTALIDSPTAGDVVFSAAISVAVSAFVLLLGRNRQRWHTDRAAAAEQLARAQAQSRQAADAERHRLARELHDVTAHHLTSIVVTASAAQRLTGTRPELMAEALQFAARTGRETLAALHRLVAVMQTPDEEPARPAELLEELADGHRLLGQVVSVDAAPGALPPAHADAVHGIAREALTNTLRYAPGSTVRVRLTLTAAGAELVVHDDGPRTPGAGAGLGSGRGTTGMTERATALGGTLAAGPRPEGGWQVRAVLPAGATHPVAVRPWWTRIRNAWAVDVVLVPATLLLPIAALVTEQQDAATARGAGELAVLVGLLTGHALPLLWRRRHPWCVLAAVAVTTLGWPAVIGTGVASGNDGYLIAVSVFADLAAVWAVAVYATGPPAVTWLSAPVVAGSTALSGALLIAFDNATPADGADVGGTAFATAVLTLLLGVLLVIPAMALWGAGTAIRRRRTRLLTGEGTALAVATYQAIESARAERFRVAGGLRQAVLHRTAAVASAAENGDLDAVLTEARAALAAMRGLLSGLRDAPAAVQPVAPQPTAAGIGALCARHPAARFQVVGFPRALPADVDVSAYRVVELLLGADRPVQVDLLYVQAGVRIVVAGGTPAADGATAAGLRARVEAVGGVIVVEPSGMIDVRLPAPVPAPIEEVASSPSV
jgi:signal transduction histidine kinase